MLKKNSKRRRLSLDLKANPDIAKALDSVKLKFKRATGVTPNDTEVSRFAFQLLAKKNGINIERPD